MEIKDGRIHYRLLNGGGETVTLLCGHMRSLRDFTSIARFLQAENFQVLLLDNRGSGATECSLDFSLAQMAHDVRNLWRHLGIASSHVVGFSMGGVIAQEVLRQNSMGVASLAMVSSLSLSRLGEVFSESHWESWPSDFSVLERRLRNYVGPQFLEENSAVIRGMARQIVKEIETTSFQERSEAQRRALREGSRTPAAHAGSRPIVPTALFHGEMDRIVAPREVEVLRKEFDPIRVHLLPKCGHLLLIENPNFLFRELKKFFLEL